MTDSPSTGCYWNRCSFCPERAESNPYVAIPVEEVILDLDYELLRDPKGIADYQFKNIEEFHKDDRTKIVLENIYKLILEKQAREEEAKKNIVVKKTRDKFTF